MIRISPSAESDLNGIAAEIGSHRPGVVMAWLDEIQAIFEMLDAHPNVGENRPEFNIQGCRSFSFGRYVIFFRRYGDGVEIARVIHGSRDLTNL